MPNFDTLEGEDLVQSLRDWGSLLKTYENALLELPNEATQETRKDALRTSFADKITPLEEEKVNVNLEIAELRAELNNATDPDRVTDLNANIDEKAKRVELLDDNVQRMQASRDQAINQIDNQALIIASALEGASETLDGVDDDASRIKEVMGAIALIFENMQQELSNLKGGKIPSRLGGDVRRGSFSRGHYLDSAPLRNSSNPTFDPNASGPRRPRAQGFIPNFSPAPEESRALHTEYIMGKRMHGSSRPALGWSQDVANLMGGDGRMVYDKTTQPNERAALRDHSSMPLSQTIKNSARFQGVSAAGVVPNLNYPLSDQIMDRMLERLNIPAAQRPGARHNLQEFLTRVGAMESDYDPSARAATTTASGTFQFTRGSSITALNRMENLLGANNQELPQWAQTYRTEARGTAGNRNAYGNLAATLTDDQARAMALSNFDQARGSDALLRQVITGQNRGRELYTQIHHTNPDAATVRRMNQGGFFNQTPTAPNLRRRLADPRRRRRNAWGFYT